MTDEELVRAAATSLVPQYGPGILAATEGAFHEKPAVPEIHRGIDESIHILADISVIATFLIAVIPMARLQLRTLSDTAVVRSIVLKSIKRPASLSHDEASKIVDAAIDTISHSRASDQDSKH